MIHPWIIRFPFHTVRSQAKIQPAIALDSTRKFHREPALNNNPAWVELCSSDTHLLDQVLVHLFPLHPQPLPKCHFFSSLRSLWPACTLNHHCFLPLHHLHSFLSSWFEYRHYKTKDMHSNNLKVNVTALQSLEVGSLEETNGQRWEHN